MTRRLATLVLIGATLPALLVAEPRGTMVALWPSALTIALAFVTRHIVGSLLTGALAGTFLLAGGQPVATVTGLFSNLLVPALSSPWNLSVIAFTLLMGGLVELLERGGGMAALARRMQRRAHDPKSTGLSIYLLGWLFFVDGLGNAMLIGKTLRPISDRAGISREKLAFIVDSTSSPIASIAIVSTWVAYEIAVIREGFASITPGVASGVAPYQVLIESLPYRFYPLFLLLIVLLSVRGRDVGPMVAAERDGRRRAAAVPAEVSVSSDSTLTILSAVVPLVVLLAAVTGGLWLDGGGLDRGFTGAALIETLGAANAARVFVWATSLAIGVTIALDVAVRRLPVSAGVAIVQGTGKMFRPVLILVLAWMLNGAIQELRAADYLVRFLGDRLPAGLVPSAVFLLSALVSFSTGTSWGTMAIVMPLAIPLAAAISGFTPGAAPADLVVATIGSVLAGAVFGDHASPISDTTIVSAFSSECDVMAHVRTQLPYVLGAATIAIGVGYLPAGFGISPWLLLPVGFLACWVWLRVAGTEAPR